MVKPKKGATEVVEEPSSSFANENHVHLNERNFDVLYKSWNLLLATGKYNILVHGVGSKLENLNHYVEHHFPGIALITVNGYMRSVSARQILDNIKSGFKLKSGSGGTTFDYAKRICSELESKKLDLFILVHNIDGTSLRDSNHQRVLALLAVNPRIRMVASVDHINTSAMWDESLLSQFKWASFNMTTRMPYTEELMSADVKLLDGDTSIDDEGSHTMASMNAMWQSLTQNTQSIFRCLMVLVTKKDEPAVPMIELFEAAREDFLVNNISVLKQQLVEFVDHNIVTRKMNGQGDEDVVVTANISLLKQFLESKGFKLSGSDDEDSEDDDDY